MLLELDVTPSDELSDGSGSGPGGNNVGYGRANTNPAWPGLPDKTISVVDCGTGPL